MSGVGASLQVPFPRSTDALIDPATNTPTRAWWYFFQQLYSRTGGPSGSGGGIVNDPDLLALLNDDAVPSQDTSVAAFMVVEDAVAAPIVAAPDAAAFLVLEDALPPSANELAALADDVTYQNNEPAFLSLMLSDVP